VTRHEREAEAAAAIRQCRVELAARGSTIVREAAGAAAELDDWRHYPDGEAYDPRSHVQYFLHRHAAAAARPAAATGDDGHFHLFLRGEGIPAGISPMLFADAAVARSTPPPQSAPLPRGRREEVCHLVAIAIDRAGEPTGLFATNRWVTGETWYRAADAIRLIERVRFDPARPPSLLDRWIAALVQLFAEDIAGLLEERDKAILNWRWRWPRRNVFEDPRLEVVASRPIDLEARLAAIEAPLAVATRPAGRYAVLSEAAADGWGR
jgi:hypothetical protein